MFNYRVKILITTVYHYLTSAYQLKTYLKKYTLFVLYSF